MFGAQCLRLSERFFICLLLNDYQPGVKLAASSNSDMVLVGLFFVAVLSSITFNGIIRPIYRLMIFRDRNRDLF